MSDQSNRTEKATGKKLQKAREKGQLPRSREIPSVLVLVTLVIAISAGGGVFFQHFADEFRSLLLSAFSNPTGALPSQIIEKAFVNVFFLMLFPTLTLLAVVAVAGATILGGWNVAGSALKFDLTKLNFIGGFKKLFSPTSIMMLLKNAFVVLGLTWVCWVTFRGEVETLPSLINSSVPQIAGKITHGLTLVLFRFSLFMLVVASLDYVWQLYKYNKDMKMTKEEVKDESKESEGNPQIKSRIRQKMFQNAYRNMLQQVPKATAVVTNPTHYAVAVKYDPQEMDAPMVVAKGKDFLALKIRQLAEEHQVPVVENKPLAQALYKQCEVGKNIPVMLYKAVAELIAYLYKKGKWKHKIMA